MTSPSTDRRYGLSSGLAIKAPCRAATTGPITLSGEQTVDGVALVTGNRCLVKDQTNSINNGVWVVDTGAWQRDVDFDGARDIVTGSMVKITEGSLNGGNIAEVMTTGTIVVGTTPLTFLMRVGTLAGISAFGGQLIQTASAATARLLLGITTYASTLLAAVDAAAARLVLGAAKSGANSDITSITGLTTPLSIAQGGTGATTSTFLSGYIFGLILSTAGASTTMTISAGKAVDFASTALMNLVSSITKTTSAWAVGTAVGGLDTGSIANNTWYYFYLIRRPDTGVVDVIFSLSSVSPALPTNYTQYRYIGAWHTNGSAQWDLIIQNGDYFEWSTPQPDINVSNPGTSGVLRTLSIPSIIVTVRVSVSLGTNTNFFALFTNPAATDVAASVNAFTFNSSSGTAERGGQIDIITNASKQIRSRQSASGASDSLAIVTTGWFDPRGRYS